MLALIYRTFSISKFLKSIKILRFIRVILIMQLTNETLIYRTLVLSPNCTVNLKSGFSCSHTYIRISEVVRFKVKSRNTVAESAQVCYPIVHINQAHFGVILIISRASPGKWILSKIKSLGRSFRYVLSNQRWHGFNSVLSSHVLEFSR